MSLLERLRRQICRPQNRRLVRYLLVGAVGFAINQTIFIIAFSELGLPYVVAGVLGSGISIFANYIINDSWTWRDSGSGGFVQWLWRGVKYLATRVVGVGIGTSAQIVMVEILLIDPVLSNVLKVGVGVLWGFGASEKWVWKSSGDANTHTAATPVSDE